jgi:transglutaminase-like putative cysteine protease
MSSERVLQVGHETTTSYGARVEVASHVAYLCPRSSERQRIESFELAISPAPSQQSCAPDAFGNLRTCFALYTPHDALQVHSRSRVRLVPAPIPDPATSQSWEEIVRRLHYVAGVPFEPAAEFSYASPFVPLINALRDYAAESFPAQRPCLDGAIELMHRIHADFAYQSGVTAINTPLKQIFEQRRGVCQDFAHLMIGCLRALGLPARYVSGYLLTNPPSGQTRLLGADASHAWVSVWCPRLGWNDLDPTNDVCVDVSHVTVAVGRDYGDVMPLRGVIQGGGEHTLSVAVSVLPV